MYFSFLTTRVKECEKSIAFLDKFKYPDRQYMNNSYNSNNQCYFIFGIGTSSQKLSTNKTLKRQRLGKVFSNFQRKELLQSFLENDQLTDNTTKVLAEKLNLTEITVQLFFWRKNELQRSEIYEEYMQLLQGNNRNECIEPSAFTNIAPTHTNIHSDTQMNNNYSRAYYRQPSL